MSENVEFDKLAPELIFQVMRFLESKDVAALSQTSRRFHQIIRQDYVWQRLCKEDFKLTSLEGWGETATFYDVYTQVLYPYSKCLGLWRNTKTCYGVFVHVKLEPGRICAEYCQHPIMRMRYEPMMDVRDPLQWFSPLFTVSLKEGQGQITCRNLCRPPSSLHLKITDGSLQFKCDQCYEGANQLSAEDICSAWLKESRSVQDGVDTFGRFIKDNDVAKLTHLWSSYSLQRFVLPTQSCVSPVTLGLYKGTYGGHGIEVINLYLADNGYELHGDKIQGDPNVPAGVISLYADLRQPLTLTLEQQVVEVVESLGLDTLDAPYRFPPEASQPFSLCSSIHERDVKQTPNTCKARYGGKGRIAQHGYRCPNFCPGQLVVFDDNYFGFYWIELRSFSVYRLVDENFR